MVAIAANGNRLRGWMWWIDRWRKSTAFTDMTAAEQGCYRNLLDECWLRGGALPMNERSIAKASGDAETWAAVRDVVMRRFRKDADGWHHDTVDAELQRTAKHAARQQRYRDHKASRRRHK